MHDKMCLIVISDPTSRHEESPCIARSPRPRPERHLHPQQVCRGPEQSLRRGLRWREVQRLGAQHQRGRGGLYLYVLPKESIRYLHYVPDHVQVVGPGLLLVQEWHRVRVREEGLHLHRIRRQQPQRRELHNQIQLQQGHVSLNIRDAETGPEPNVADTWLSLTRMSTRITTRKSSQSHAFAEVKVKYSNTMSKYLEIGFRMDWLDSWLLKYLKIKFWFPLTLSVFLYDAKFSVFIKWLSYCLEIFCKQ